MRALPDPAAARSARRWPVDPDFARVRQDLAIEMLELRAVVEVAQVGELMTQRVDQARILEQRPGGGVL